MLFLSVVHSVSRIVCARNHVCVACVIFSHVFSPILAVPFLSCTRHHRRQPRGGGGEVLPRYSRMNEAHSVLFDEAKSVHVCSVPRGDMAHLRVFKPDNHLGAHVLLLWQQAEAAPVRWAGSTLRALILRLRRQVARMESQTCVLAWCVAAQALQVHAITGRLPSTPSSTPRHPCTLSFRA